MTRVYCTQCKRSHEVEVNQFGALCADGELQKCDHSNWYELHADGVRPYLTDHQRQRLDDVLVEATRAGVMPEYTPDEAAIEADLLGIEKMQQGTAIVIVHNLPGTPLLSFGVYGVGRAYAAALEIVEGYQRANSHQPEDVQGQRPQSHGHASATNDWGHGPATKQN
jgi:hypothetical protein